MSPPIEHELSAEDFSLLDAHQLGTPVSIYKLRPLYIWTLRVSGFFFLGLGIILPISLLLISIIKRPGEQANEMLVIVIIGFLFLVSLSIFLAFAGMFVLRVELPRARKMHIILCEQGLLFVGKGVGNKDIEVIHWSDILTATKSKNPCGKCMIRYHENKVISLDIMYQNLDELSETVRLQIDEISYHG